jgi:Cu2+-exporting ATPase
MAEKIGSETLLSQIVQMVNDASRSRAPIQKLADRIAKYFVPIVVGVAVLTFFFGRSLVPSQCVDLRIYQCCRCFNIACPCALGLATPMSVMVGWVKEPGC